MVNDARDTSTMESWRDIPGYERCYQVSNHGNVRSLDRKNARGFKLSGRQLYLAEDRHGYNRVKLHKDKLAKDIFVHRLVLLAFHSQTTHKKDVNHKDGNPLNNHLSNLEWCTKSENMLHSHRKLGRPVGGAKLNKDLAQRIKIEHALGNITQKVLASKYGVSPATISLIVNGKVWM